MKRINSSLSIRFLSAVAIACAVCVLANIPVQGAVTNYFDGNDISAGFGAPNGTFLLSTANVWSTAADGTAATTNFNSCGGSGNVMAFGASGSDLSGCSITLNCDVGNPPNFSGLVINGTNCTITLSGSGNFFLNGSQTWIIPAGAILNEAIITAMNFNQANLTLSGGGTINFITSPGNNDGNFITENGTGLVVNLYTNNTGNPNSTFGFTLQNGTLNFASAASSNAFIMIASNRAFSINGGILDNTSGSPMTLNITNSAYSIGGDFTFKGTSSLSLGTNSVTLGTNSTITVNSNMLTIAGAISGAYGLTKAGAGTLTLQGTNIYTGATAVSNGVLSVTGSIASTNWVIAAGATLSFAGATDLAGKVLTIDAGAVSAGLLSVNGDLTLGGDFRMADGVTATNCTSARKIIQSTTTISGNFASIVLPRGFSSYVKGGKEFWIMPMPGTVIRIK